MRTVLVVVLTALMLTPSSASAAPTCIAPIAHRGVHNAHIDEETIDAIVKAPGIAEIDLHITKDNHIVLMHDKGVNRTTNGDGLVHDLTLAEIKTFRTVKSGSTVPTFSEAVHAAESANVQLVAELKLYQQWTPQLLTTAANLANNASVRVYLGGRGKGFERTLPNYADHIYWRPLRGVAPTVANAKARSATMVMDRIKNFTPESVAALNKAGFVTSTRLTTHYRAAQNLGVNYVLTNYPFQVIAFCKKA